jgi:MPBQ/MSBQ methyltransferase
MNGGTVADHSRFPQMTVIGENGPLMQSGSFGARYDDVISSPKMQRLYGDSGYFNVGYWAAGVTDLVAACDRMVDEVASAIAPDARTVVDAGCGPGAGTRRLARLLPRATVIGANVSLWQLRTTRRRGLSALATDAALLGIASGSADAVVALESALHFNTRDAFFAEAFRVLRPGGMLTVADMLFRDADAIGPWMVPPANRVGGLAEYEQRVRAAGFTAITSRDVTATTWKPFCNEMRRVYRGEKAALRAIADSVSHYLLLSARKP